MSETPAEPPSCTLEPGTIRFRLVHFVNGTALLASSIAAFGKTGILPGVLILGAWTYIFASRSRPRALIIVCEVILIGSFLCFFLFLRPAVETARGVALRSVCKNNFKQIWLGLQNYHERYGSYPPAYVADQNGRPTHSWRVLLLP